MSENCRPPEEGDGFDDGNLILPLPPFYFLVFRGRIPLGAAEASHGEREEGAPREEGRAIGRRTENLLIECRIDTEFTKHAKIFIVRKISFALDEIREVECIWQKYIKRNSSNPGTATD